MEDLNELKRKIKKFNFKQKHGFSRLLIQLFGFSGNGKSSFINTCKYIWDDEEFINHTRASSNHGGQTMNRISYPLTKTITLVDNRGCSTMDRCETGEIYAQLANLLPLDTPVEWSRGLAERIRSATGSVKPTDFIVPIFVYSAKKSISSEDKTLFRELLSKARDVTGIFPIVVFTYKTHGDVAEKERIFRNLGVERVFAFENYTPSDHIRTRGRDEVVLRFLLEVIKDVKYQVDQPRNHEREMLQRKQFVLKYVREQGEQDGHQFSTFSHRERSQTWKSRQEHPHRERFKDELDHQIQQKSFRDRERANNHREMPALSLRREESLYDQPDNPREMPALPLRREESLYDQPDNPREMPALPLRRDESVYDYSSGYQNVHSILSNTYESRMPSYPQEYTKKDTGKSCAFQ